VLNAISYILRSKGGSQKSLDPYAVRPPKLERLEGPDWCANNQGWGADELAGTPQGYISDTGMHAEQA